MSTFIESTLESPDSTSESLPTQSQIVNDNTVDSSFQVPFSVHFLSSLVEKFPGLFRKLGNLETHSLSTTLNGIKVESPIYIAGIARSGTTILLEALSRHPEAVTHRYRDFPFLHMPYWWNQSQQKNQAMVPVERAHGDGISVTPESPESMEEVLWQSFFKNIHDPAFSQVLDSDFRSPEFEQFYRDHIHKILYIHNKRRYLSKGNYNFSRLGYLQKMFPDARFIVPIRHPQQHIASLMKQHRLFVTGENKYPRALKQMQRIGHFEFGLDRRPINVGNHQVIQQIQELWKSGKEVRGWARYWAHLYGWMADQCESNTVLRQAVHFIRYEDLCQSPLTELNELAAHAKLELSPELLEFSGQIQAPTYYQASFTSEEQQIIKEETSDVADRYGY